MDQPLKPQTRVNHPPRVAVRPSNPPLVDPIYHSVKFTADSGEEMIAIHKGEKEGFLYSRISNPTVRQLEMLLAEVQGREETIAFVSGVAAITVTLFSLLKSGDHVIHFRESYKPSRSIIRSTLGRYGVRSTMLELGDWDALERTLKKTPTQLILFESPSNPILKLVDIEKMTTLAKAYGALTLMDNTFAGFHQHGDFPVDLYLHSLTKFAGGHGDTTGGALIGSTSLIHRIRLESYSFGAALDPMTAAQITRGMKTYFLRYQRQCENAMTVARWLEKQPQVQKVRYPGLPSHPDHALAERQMRNYGTVISFELKNSMQMIPFLDRLQLFTLTASLGSTDSLVAPGLAFYGTDLSKEDQEAAGIFPGTIRLSLGIEDVNDLIADLGQGLSGHI